MSGEHMAENAQPEVPYLDLYGEPRGAWITDSDYDPVDLWEGTDYTAVDTRSDTSITLHWDERDGWLQR